MTDVDSLPPVKYLLLEVLAARWGGDRYDEVVRILTEGSDD